MYARDFLPTCMAQSISVLTFAGCYPFQEDEPFVITECPHVFFVGNQPQFASTVLQGRDGQSIRLIAIPPFKETGQVVLLDLETLELDLIQVDV